ncbi:MAG TPA: succinate dehydrogenase, hydrophobic membrane anchor protein [Steroidobacteraceae bacterium]|nr:succinate dehydrogenase, hydrophobic membrane anchor protein [Steroidobacteraceae bacterium]
MSLRSPLGRVLGQGAAHSGVRHWWQQRLTALALVPLAAWFVVSLLALPSLGYATLSAWVSQGSTALLLILLMVVSAWHSQLGVRVVVEDYVHARGARTLTLVVTGFAHVLVVAAGAFAVLKLALGRPS